LQAPIEDSEWGMLCADKDLRKKMEKAAKRRDENFGGLKKVRRIDWLGEKTSFKGLEKDDDFVKARLLPGGEACKETWVVKFAP